MRALLLFVSVCIWSLIFTVIDAWSLPQRSGRSVKTMTRAIPIQFIVIRQEWATRAELHRMTNAAITYLRNNGVRANVRWRRWENDPIKLNRIADSDDIFFIEFTTWREILKERNITRPFTTTAVVAPPWIINGTRFMAGYAFKDSYYWGGYSYSNVHMFNSSGFSRYRHSVVGIIHEILHTLGCGHEDGPNIMHPNAFAEQQLIEGAGLLLPIGPRCRVVIERLKR